MAKFIKKQVSQKTKVERAVNKYDVTKKLQSSLLTEAFISDSGYKKYNQSLIETAVKSRRTRDMVVISLKRPNVILYETSLYNQPTLDSAETIEKVLSVCQLSRKNVHPHTHYDDQTIADYICYYLPVEMGDELIEEKFKQIDKIMTACGYFMAIEPDITNVGFGDEYTIQYEPNEPDCRKVYLPDELHHLTTVVNSKSIAKEGFIPKKNDIYKYSDRTYFVECVDDSVVVHLVRRHRDKLIRPGTTQTIEYADIAIDTPRDIKFYIDYHIKNVNSFFTFDKIDSKYIKNIEIKEFGSMLSRLRPL